jgi:hypothetical protein
MRSIATIRKLATAVLVLAILVWAEAGLALVLDQPVMQCSMSAHEMQAMGEMPCCPDDAAVAPASSHAQCCANGDLPERPLGFVLSSAKQEAQSLEVAAELPLGSAAPASHRSVAWQSDDTPRYVKSVLERKTDLRI